MAEFSNELISKLKKAKDREEVFKLLKAAGQDTAAADKIWKELEGMRSKDGSELSLEELDAVAGGVKHRDWIEDGCAATVEPGSDCWRTDGGCTLCNIKYSKMPTVEWTCPTCGKPCYEVSDSYYVTVYQCRIHGKWRKSRAGQWTIEHID